MSVGVEDLSKTESGVGSLSFETRSGSRQDQKPLTAEGAEKCAEFAENSEFF